MSSVSSGTTTTTSSSMSSSTCGDLAELLGQIQVKEAVAASSPTARRAKDNSHSSPSNSSGQVHSVIKCSPRKANVKKSDSCMQTDSASAVAATHGHQHQQQANSIYSWKKYLHEHALKGDGRPSSANSSGSPAKIAIVSSVQSSDEGRSPNHRENSPRKSSHSSSPSGSKMQSSSVYTGRAVAVIRASPSATTGRCVGTKPSASSVRSAARDHIQPQQKAGSHPRGYSSEIYSDTECMSGSSLKSYPFCLTSQVLQSQVVGQNNSLRESRDRLSSIYGQVRFL